MKNIIIFTLFTMFSVVSKAESIVFYDFSDLTDIQLNGEAVNLNPNSGDVLSLTDDLWQSGSAFFTDTLSLDNLASFSIAFEFQISDPQGIYDNDGQGADGLAFVVQSNSNTVGANGGGIGYMGIDNSLAIEFDTWRNGQRDNGDGNHVGINLDGNLASVAQASVSPRMNNDAVWTAWIDYDGLRELVEVRVSEDSVRPTNAIVSADVNLSETLGTTDAYIGFTSGTGAAGGDHNILSMVFHDDYNPVSAIVVSEPKSLLVFIGSIFLLLISRSR